MFIPVCPTLLCSAAAWRGAAVLCMSTSPKTVAAEERRKLTLPLPSPLIQYQTSRRNMNEKSWIKCSAQEIRDRNASLLPSREGGERGNDKSSSQLKPSSSSMFVIMNWKRDFGFFSKGTHLGYFLMHVTGSAEKRMLRCGSHKRVGQELFITSHDRVSKSTLILLRLLHFFKKNMQRRIATWKPLTPQKVHRN